jgi:hypothetical protein
MEEIWFTWQAIKAKSAAAATCERKEVWKTVFEQ